MSFALLYDGADSQVIQDSYQAARTTLPAADRQNIDACWTGGLSTWNSPGNLVYSPGPPEVWNPVCRNPDGTPNTGLCDKDTHLIQIGGNYAANSGAATINGVAFPDYGARRNQAITKAGFVALLRRLAQADSDLNRRAYLQGIADDVVNTAIEPYP